MGARDAEQVLDSSLLLDKLGVGLPCLNHLVFNHVIASQEHGTECQASMCLKRATTKVPGGREGFASTTSASPRVYHMGLSVVVCQISGAPLEAAANLLLFTNVLPRFGISALHDAGWRRVLHIHMVGVHKFVMRRAR